MPRRAIVIYPALDNLAQVEALRQRFDPLAEVIAAHITLVFPFDSGLSTEALRAEVQRAAAGQGPFPVRLQGITGHAGEYLLLNVKRGNDAIIKLHDRLYSGALAPYHSREFTYLPHLTIGHLADPADFLQALEAARAVATRFEAVVSEVAVFGFGDGALEFRVTLG